MSKMQIKQKSVSCLSRYIMTSTNALRNYSSTLEDCHPVQWSHMTTNWCTHTHLCWFPFMWLAMDQPTVLSELQSFTHYNHSLAMDTEIQQKSMKVSVRIHWPHEIYDKDTVHLEFPLWLNEINGFLAALGHRFHLAQRNGLRIRCCHSCGLGHSYGWDLGCNCGWDLIPCLGTPYAVRQPKTKNEKEQCASCYYLWIVCCVFFIAVRSIVNRHMYFCVYMCAHGHVYLSIHLCTCIYRHTFLEHWLLAFANTPLSKTREQGGK